MPSEPILTKSRRPKSRAGTLAQSHLAVIPHHYKRGVASGSDFLMLAPDSSVVVEEFLRIHQRPHDVFDPGATIGRAANPLLGGGQLLRAGRARQRRQIEMPDDLAVGPVLREEARDGAVRVAQLR